MAEHNNEYREEEARLAALKAYDVLDTLPEGAYDDIVKLASEICHTPIALISLLDEERQWFKARVGLDVAETAREISFCRHAITGNDIFEVPDALADQRFQNNPLVTGAPDIRFYAGAPLVEPGGHKIGTLCVINVQPQALTAGQRESLQILSRAVVNLMELRKEKKVADSFQLALEEVSAISIISPDMRFLYVNDAYCRLVALDKAQIIGRHINEIGLADLTDEQMATFTTALEERKIWKGKIRNQNAQGNVSWSNTTVIPHVSSNNELVNILTIRQNITDEVLTTERLGEAETIARVGSWEYNIASNGVTWSPGLYAIADYDNRDDKAPGLSIADLAPPADAVRLRTVIAEALEGDGTERRLEFDIVTGKHNRKRLSAIIKRRLTGKGNLAGIHGTLQDITDEYRIRQQLEESEGKYRALVEDSAQMLFTSDAEGRYTYVSPRLKKMLGYGEADIIGRQFAFIYNDEWRKKAIIFYNDQLIRKIKETAFVFPIKNAEGEKLWIEQVATLVMDGDHITGFRCVLHDITARVATEEAMQEAARLAMEAKELQHNFLGKMSHEIRTPMNGVLGMVNLLNTTVLSAEQQQYVSDIKESSVEMLRILTDILDVSKMLSGKLEYEKVKFDPVLLMNNVVFTLSPEAAKKQLSLTAAAAANVPASVTGDPTRLTQVLLSIAGNAVKFTEIGNIYIALSVKQATPGTIILEFVISDTGIGIPQSAIPTIFDSFTQAEGDDTRKYNGAGLGLTIARQLVEQQGGTISVVSTEGKGSAFTFTCHCEPVAERAAKRELQRTDKGMIVLDGCKVLLVEDNVMNQKVARFTIEKWGAKVILAESGFVAIDLLKEEAFDVILMDIQMPGMSGFQATEVIRAELKVTTPIIAMTASAVANEREHCLAAGMNDYVAKPFDPVELNDKIHMHWQQQDAPPALLTSMDYINEQLSADADLIKEILGIYLANTPATVDRIDGYLATADYATLGGEIHNLKNSVGMVGATVLYDRLSAIERMLGLSPLPPEVFELLATARKEIITTIKEVEDYIAGM